MTAVVVDTGVFSASLSHRRQSIASLYDRHLRGRQLVIAPQTVAEMRFGALVAGWGDSRLAELERRVALARVAVIENAMIWSHARLRSDCRATGHALAQQSHASDLWVGVTAVHFDIPLVTHDNLFQQAPRLTVISALTERDSRAQRPNLRKPLELSKDRDVRPGQRLVISVSHPLRTFDAWPKH